MHSNDGCVPIFALKGSFVCYFTGHKNCVLKPLRVVSDAGVEIIRSILHFLVLSIPYDEQDE